MKLNLQTDFALRLLMHLAVNKDHLCTIADIAERYSISKNHLMKVAHTLAHEGLVKSVRGRSGGLRLKRQASQIVVGDVVRLMETDLALVECFQGGAQTCLITPACKLKGVLAEAIDAFLSTLDNYTLDDLVRQNLKLRDLLSAEAA